MNSPPNRTLRPDGRRGNHPSETDIQSKYMQGMRFTQDIIEVIPMYLVRVRPHRFDPVCGAGFGGLKPACRTAAKYCNASDRSHPVRTVRTRLTSDGAESNRIAGSSHRGSRKPTLPAVLAKVGDLLSDNRVVRSRACRNLLEQYVLHKDTRRPCRKTMIIT
jgi:hypothetical protein